MELKRHSSSPPRGALIDEAKDNQRASSRSSSPRHRRLRAALKHVHETIARVRRTGAPRGPAQPYDFRTDPMLREALDYWKAKGAAGAMPRRRDIDPCELPRHLLPQLQLIDVIEGGRRFYFRLVGTAIVEAFGGEFTGRYTEDVIAADHIEFVHGCYRMVMAERRPILVRSRYLTSKAVDITANRLLMPLSEDGDHVSMILGALTFELVGGCAGDHHGKLDETSTYFDVVP
jgi:hypothetical protein